MVQIQRRVSAESSPFRTETLRGQLTAIVDENASALASAIRSTPADRSMRAFLDEFKVTSLGATEQFRDGAEIGNIDEKLDVLTCQSQLASLNIIGSKVEKAAFQLQLGNELAAYGEYRSSKAKAEEILPSSHSLVQALEERMAEVEFAMLDVQAARKESGVVQGDPEIEFTKKGFELQFRLPERALTNPEDLTQKNLTEFLIALTKEAERMHAREHIGIGPYDNTISEHSVTNTIARKGPKLYDPDGNYRGRISSNTIGKHSITNTIGKFGSDIKSSSMFYVLNGNDSSDSLKSMLSGVWRIVADQS